MRLKAWMNARGIRRIALRAGGLLPCDRPVLPGPARTLALLLLVAFLLVPAVSQAMEQSLYDPDGEAVGYMDTRDQMSIYLWDGQPVAYLDGPSIYGFNGRHLGWLKDGIVIDHDGYAVGFAEGAFNRPPRLERLKGVQQLAPLRALPEFEPLEPLQRGRWSDVPLAVFLSMGKK